MIEQSIHLSSRNTQHTTSLPSKAVLEGPSYESGGRKPRRGRVIIFTLVALVALVVFSVALGVGLGIGPKKRKTVQLSDSVVLSASVFSRSSTDTTTTSIPSPGNGGGVGGGGGGGGGGGAPQLDTIVPPIRLS